MISLFKNSPFSSTKLQVNIWKFPGGEVGVKVIDEIRSTASYSIVVNGIISSADIFAILNICDVLRVNFVPVNQVTLEIPYVPYGRQDRVCHIGESNALGVFGHVLKTGYFGHLRILDPHSAATVEHLYSQRYNLVVTNQATAAAELPLFNTLIAPDQGASTKVLTHDQVLNHSTKVVVLSKTRTSTGIEYNDYGYDTINGSVCVVDDLADGGATFIELAKMLIKTQPNITSLSLYVTHGIFSKGFGDLAMFYDKIYVSNMMCDSVYNKELVIII